MLKRTIDYKNKLYFIDGYENRISFLKDKYKDKACFIIAPGPSSCDPQLESLQNSLKNNLVFCVKDSYDYFQGVCDFHFFNDCNLPVHNSCIGYQYEAKNEPIIIGSSGFEESVARQRIGDYQQWDIFCKVLDPSVYPNNNMGYVLQNEDFEKGTFDNTYWRPCGPSLVIETVIYMALHVGVKNIFAIGVDGGTKWQKSSDQNRRGIHLDASPKTQHELDYKNWEIEITHKGTRPLYDWLKKKNINLFLISKVSNWHSKIPRVSVHQVNSFLKSYKGDIDGKKNK